MLFCSSCNGEPEEACLRLIVQRVVARLKAEQEAALSLAHASSTAPCLARDNRGMGRLADRSTFIFFRGNHASARHRARLHPQSLASALAPDEALASLQIRSWAN